MNEDNIFVDEEPVNTEPTTPPGYQPGPKKGLASTALVLGLVSLVFFLFTSKILKGVTAIILAIVYLVTHKGKDGKAMAIIGLISGMLSIMLLIASWTLVYANAGNMVPVYEEILELYGIDLEAEYPEYNVELDVEDTL